ncbi:phosphoglycerate mutase family protein [Cladophialophora carrionii]|uniref:Phosphoglycerate mutase family protein n=1 Tax=Cladophialophora carrionii TaxID=86049 RepID=A0A1C1CY33_9EURO|nr:phosphoglycerate mutase family protein [Cladophialophora carrionii]
MHSQPKIHLVRHAQGFHNLGTEFHSLPDPRLTPLGESQCAKLQEEHFPAERQESISLITASPLTRTLHTAFLTFKPALTSKSVKCKPTILAIPDAQETSDYPCDTGSDVPVLKAFVEEQKWPVDLSLLTDTWNVKTLENRYSPASAAIKARARDCRKLLREKARELARGGDDNVEIVLVTHGGYLHYLTDDWEDAAKLSGTGWENTEYRTYTFETSFLSDDDSEAHLTETLDSRHRRGISHPMPDHEKQKELFERMMQGWEDQGLQNPAKLSPAVVDEEAEEHGQQPADLQRHVTHAADEAEKTEINTQTQPQSVTVRA